MSKRNLYKTILLAGFLVTMLVSCQKNWLDRQPTSILTDEQIWNDVKMLDGLLANYYDRLPAHATTTGAWQNMAEYDEAMWSGFSNDEWRNNLVDYGYDRWRLYDYGLIRDINLSIEKATELTTKLTESTKGAYIAEFRFLRALMYFEMVKRMGGVPLVTQQLIYDFSGNVTPMQVARSREDAMYDFVASELDDIKDKLGNSGSKTRANKYTALALKSRAMLYAASIAKYNNLLPSPITTSGGEVGIPASKAADYYAKSLAASKEIINSGVYSLYNNNPDKGANFYEAVASKTNNAEVILAQDFLASGNKRVGFTYDNIARSVREDNLGSSAVTPSLNLVESYEYLNGTPGTLKLKTTDNSDYIYYDNLQDIFANKDARLYGTIIYPGTTFRSLPVNIQAGVAVWNGTAYNFVEGSNIGTNYTDGGVQVGTGGPHRTQQEVTNTGFYLRKYIDNKALASTRGVLSEMWWVRFRLGEIYLNAAEAALETGNTTDALFYVNKIRERAGFPANSLATINLTKIQNERKVELAFEDHRVWDLMRWRQAHILWDGQPTNENAMVYALYPYRVIRPGDAARNNKYIFVKMVAPRFKAPRKFRMGNYYSSFDSYTLLSNPKIVPNPFH